YIAYTDKRKNLWYIDLESGKSVKVDTDRMSLGGRPDADWSPDGAWLVYSKSLPSRVGAVFLYSLKTGKSHQVTDGMSDVRSVVFDKGGKSLYFTASTDAGPLAFGTMSAFNRGMTSSAYVVVLSKDDPSPLLPESDDEKETAAKPGEKPADKEKE